MKTKFGRLCLGQVQTQNAGGGSGRQQGGHLPVHPHLGTLVSSGVPILQALTIVKETSGNVIVSNAVSAVHESVKEGETITAPLEASGVFPPMVISHGGRRRANRRAAGNVAEDRG